METPDLNLLVALDVLLEEGSVAAAARRLRLSASAMSRTLARLREVTGDPLLVRAGRRLVPTPRAAELAQRVGPVVQEARALLHPGAAVDVRTLVRTFTLRTSDGFVETFGPALIARVAADAPGVRLRFVQKLTKESGPLRDGEIDLETGVVGTGTGPELRAQGLFRDRFVGAVRPGHPLAGGEVTAQGYAGCRHVVASRRGTGGGPVDDALALLGLERDVAAVVGGFASALALVRGTDLVATVPARHTEGLREGLHTFPLPFAVPEVLLSLLWHPRLDADPAHRWLRRCVRDACAEPDPQS